MKSDGIRTLVRKLRLCQSGRGRRRTRVECFVEAPSSDCWRTIFLRLFFEKGIGTFPEAYELQCSKQNFSQHSRRLIGAGLLKARVPIQRGGLAAKLCVTAVKT